MSILSSAVFIRLPFTPDLTQAGVLYACRQLATGLTQVKDSHPDALRRLVVEVAAEVAFRRWLVEQGILFKSVPAAPFSQPFKDDLLVAGRRCHLINTPVPHRIHTLLEAGEDSRLLSAPACLAETMMNSDLLGHSDLLLFAFTGVLPEMSWHERRHTPESSQRLFLIYILPNEWQSIPLPWKLTNQSDQAIDVELGGSSPESGYLNQALNLPPGHSVQVEGSAKRSVFLSTGQIPTGNISIRAAGGQRHQVSSLSWSNVWVEGSVILLAGGITVGEFRRRARHTYRLDPPWGELPLPARGLSLPVRDLSPLGDYLGG